LKESIMGKGREIGETVTEINPCSESCAFPSAAACLEAYPIMRPRPPSDAAKVPPGAALAAEGKFFRQQGRKISFRGVCYGPFRPNSRHEPFPEDARLSTDFDHIRQLGFDTVRLYEPPSDFLLSEAIRTGLRLIVGITWTDHVDFLSRRGLVRQAHRAMEVTALRLGRHPAVAAFLVGNEIEKNLARWMGPERVRKFLEQLIDTGRAAAPERLFSYATYPSTEYLIPRNADFLAINVFLEERADFAAYLARLQILAGNKPLVISEFGLDATTAPPGRLEETFGWFEDECRRAAIAGTLWFAYTDEWHRGGRDVTDWRFGLVDRDRRPRMAVPPMASGENTGPPVLISVIVCTYNGSATLAACLESLESLNHSAYEVLLIDDGSTEDIGRIVRAFPEVRYLRQDHAGLSAARNLGMREAQGELLAYTDDDCIADEDWLRHAAAAFDNDDWAACGGPNIPPRPRNATEAVVASAPGSPTHVMLNDVEAEHLPGCNLIIRKASLKAIGGFREQYHTAGDDVDVCWRLREAGGRLRFVPGAMVWHHRRRTLQAYLRQQRGYGHAEALLMKDHPERFTCRGGARWQGTIYEDSPSSLPLNGRIFHGPQGMGLFQGIYQNQGWHLPAWANGLSWTALLLITLPVLGWRASLPFLGLFLLALWKSWRHLPTGSHAWSGLQQLQLLLLNWLQPIVRGWARWSGILRFGLRPEWQPGAHPCAGRTRPPRFWTLCHSWQAYWNEDNLGREALLSALKDCLGRVPGLNLWSDDGWQPFDLAWSRLPVIRTTVLTLTEHHGEGRCLTRVRLSLQCHPWAAAAAGGLALLSWFVWKPGIGAIALLLLLVRARQNQKCNQAAAAAGLAPCPNKAPLVIACHPRH
jgi:GT2 family glycosyltransferase